MEVVACWQKIMATSASADEFRQDIPADDSRIRALF
jgi:hypothetical protein